MPERMASLHLDLGDDITINRCSSGVVITSGEIIYQFTRVSSIICYPESSNNTTVLDRMVIAIYPHHQ